MWKNIPKNYVDEKYPELISLFKNKKDSHNGVTSSKKVEFICPCCHKIYIKPICSIVRSGRVPCITCSDGFSYPEKFMANILRQLNIDFKYHVKEDWTQNYIYDFIFDYNNQKYIIETDGGLGHGHNEISNRTKEETLLIDKEKDNIANKNGYIMIRIDCNYTDNNRYNYIKNSICASLLFLFDLSKIDWEKCHLNSLESKFKVVVDCYKTGTKFLDEIEKFTNIKQRTILKYLKEAMATGILKEEKILKSNPYKKLPQNIQFVNDGKFNGRSKLLYCYNIKTIFSSISAAANFLSLNEFSLRQALAKNNGYYKDYHFIYYDKLPKDFDFENYDDIKKESFRNQNIYQYNPKTQKLVCVYENINQILVKYPNYLYQNIWRVCTGKRKTAYGYIWSLYNIGI